MLQNNLPVMLAPIMLQSFPNKIIIMLQKHNANVPLITEDDGTIVSLVSDDPPDRLVHCTGGLLPVPILSTQTPLETKQRKKRKSMLNTVKGSTCKGGGREGMEGGREGGRGGREGGRERGREGGREGKREGGREEEKEKRERRDLYVCNKQSYLFLFRLFQIRHF